MRAIWTLARKECALLLRDRLATLILLVMPLLFILILGLLLGENFGQKSDDRLRIALVDLDTGKGSREESRPQPADKLALNVASTLTLPSSQANPFLVGWTAEVLQKPEQFSARVRWADVVRRDLAETAEIRVETVKSLELAQELVRFHKRAAIVVLDRDFSNKVDTCSFLQDGINPFHRDGVYLDRVAVKLLKDDKQPGASAIIEQVVQVSLLRVLMPWMISKAFEKLSQREFIELMGNKVRLPVPKGADFLFTVKGIKLEDGKASLNDALRVAAPNQAALDSYRDKVGMGVQDSLKVQFKKFNLLGRTWADLTRATDPRPGEGAEAAAFVNRDGSGFFNRGAQRYQVLVPSYTVMFAFFLVMNVGWIFVAERRQGTLKRLRAAPLTRGQVLLGKLLPCFVLSVGQGLFLLLAGRLVFGMKWGPDAWPLWEQLLYLLPVVFCTSLAAMGLALLVAALARTEMQVALYGAVPVLVLALIGGCVLPREMMPEQAQQFSFLTPQGWALDAYRELLDPQGKSIPNLEIVGRACAVLAGFGVGFLGIAWALLRLE